MSQVVARSIQRSKARCESCLCATRNARTWLHAIAVCVSWNVNEKKICKPYCKKRQAGFIISTWSCLKVSSGNQSTYITKILLLVQSFRIESIITIARNPGAIKNVKNYFTVKKCITWFFKQKGKYSSGNYLKLMSALMREVIIKWL